MLRSSLHAVLTLVLSSVLVAPVRATTCVQTDRCYTSTTVLSEWTGTPTVLCLTGHPVVRIESSADCHGTTAGPAVVLRCGVSSQAFSYSGPNNKTHTLETNSNWENVLWGACSDLVYSVN
jgi:hypothetical protein